MPTRNLVVTDHQERLIRELVESGRYQNASEVMREGLRLIERREELDRQRIQALREAVQVGLDDERRGALIDYYPGLVDDIDAELDRE